MLDAIVHLVEQAGRLPQQVFRVSELANAPVREDQNSVVVRNSVESVRYREHSGAALDEVSPQHPLYALVRVRVHGRGGLVHHQHLALPQRRPRDAEQLPLSLRDVGARLLDGRLQPARHGAHRPRHEHLLQHRPDRRIRVLAEGVQLEAQRAREQHRLLRDDGQIGPTNNSRKT
jgi:hypothetical protein